MKNKKLLAVAIAATLSAGAAQAGTLAISNNGAKVPQFATHIFGTGSDAQTIYLPNLVYVAKAPVAAGKEIRFNLLDGALFGKQVKVSHFAVNAGGNVDTNDGTDADVQIVSGGSVGSFHVTVKLAEALAAGDTVTLFTGGELANLDDDTYANFTLAAAAVNPLTNVEIKTAAKLGTAGTTISASVSIEGGIDPTPAVVVATSADPLKLTVSATDIAAAAANTINMADSDKLFSVGAGFGSTSLATPGQTFNHAGKFTLAVNTNNYDFLVFDGLATNAATNLAAGAVASGTKTTLTQISDPAGNQYAPDGADTVTLSLAAGSATGFNSLSKVWLDAGLCDADNAGAFKNLTIGSVPASGSQTATVDISTIAYGTPYNICTVAKSTVAIEPQKFVATVNYENAEPTFKDQPYTGDAATWVRNGCAAAFFNVTSANGTAADETFLRLTNTTNSAGPVRVRAWAQDGSNLGADGALLSNELKGHATAVFTPEQVRAALGVSAWTGRARVVLFGGFNSCVGQNMTRAGGVLINSTPTTDGNNDGITPATTTNSGN